ncbi:MAG TPA: hypothetical protein VIG06_16405 [Kofleriaceae bacterium]|jgi:hypothetical protein
MPTSGQITAAASEIANRWLPLAVAWHLAVVAVLIALARGWRPARRTAGLLIAAPSISVAAMAWLAGNPFNGSIFTLLAAGQVLLALRLAPGRIERGPGWAMVAGTALVGFGLFYPHFLVDRAPAMYLVAAPFGLVPCPTIAVAIGVTLCAGGFQGRGWSALMVAAGSFYALYGALRLGVALDVGLLAGTVALALLLALGPAHRPMTAANSPGGGR